MNFCTGQYKTFDLFFFVCEETRLTFYLWLNVCRADYFLIETIAWWVSLWPFEKSLKTLLRLVGISFNTLISFYCKKKKKKIWNMSYRCWLYCFVRTKDLRFWPRFLLPSVLSDHYFRFCRVVLKSSFTIRYAQQSLFKKYAANLAQHFIVLCSTPQNWISRMGAEMNRWLIAKVCYIKTFTLISFFVCWM